MLNYYLVKSKDKYLNTDGEKPKLVEKKLATRYDDEFSADCSGEIYCENYTIEPESYDK